MAEQSLLPYRADLETIVDLVFRTMLGLEVFPCEIQYRPSDQQLTAAVHFAGEWKGAVIVECDKAMARRFATRLMPVDDPETMSNNDVLDAIGELVNMVGGNMKSVMPRGVGLSMPSIVEGSDYSMRICGGNHISRQAFRAELGVFWVTVVEVAN